MLVKGHHQLLMSANLFFFSRALPQPTSFLDCPQWLLLSASHRSSANSMVTSARHGEVFPRALLSTLGAPRSYSHPGSQSLQNGSQFLPFFYYHFLSEELHSHLAWVLYLLTSSSQIILSTHTHHRFPAQDYRKMSLQTNLRHSHKEVPSNKFLNHTPSVFYGTKLGKPDIPFLWDEFTPGRFPRILFKEIWASFSVL